MSDIQETLETRENHYGNFMGTATAAQDIKAVIVKHSNTVGTPIKQLDADMQESLSMIATKIGRIITGDPWYSDSWIDIAGYATLVADRLQKEGF